MIREMKQMQRENTILRNIVSHTISMARNQVNGKTKEACHAVNVLVQDAMYLNIVVIPNEQHGLYATPEQGIVWDGYTKKFIKKDRKQNTKLIK